MNFFCPYCDGELPLPTHKRTCVNCDKTIFVRTRPNQSKQWVREEDLPCIAKEWSDEMLKRDMQQQKETGIYTLHLARNNIREWVKSGSVKSLKLYTAGDESVCDICKQVHGKIFPINTYEQIKIVMENAHMKNCKNPVCRCYWRPEDISID